MQIRFYSYILIAIAFVSTACNKVNFEGSTNNPSVQIVTEPVQPSLPITPPVVPVPAEPVSPSLPQPTMKTGACTQGSALTSCMSCPSFQAPKWQPSTKAEKLAYILYMSCPIHNKSDPAFNIPTLEQSLSVIQACTKDLYPETKSDLTTTEYATIDKLLSETDDSMRRKFFAGLWYQPPFTDHFEAYFGLYHAEARQMFCYGQNHAVISGDLLTSEWYKNCGTDPMSSTCTSWLANKKTSGQFFRTQAIRKQLYDCIGKSAQLAQLQPWQPPKCDYRTYEGYFEVGGAAELANLFSQGYSFSVEYNNQCYQPSAVLPAMQGQVKISGYRCQ